MKKKTSLFGILVITVLCLALLPGTARAADSGTCGEHVTWTLDDNGTLTISGTGAMEDYKSGTKPSWSSQYKSIKAVVIESGVTSIGNCAFEGCSQLTSVKIPDGVTSIGIYAFSSCSKLTSAKIPDGVTSIGGCAFFGCRSLAELTLPDSVTSFGREAFRECDSLTSVTIPGSVASIADNAFMACKSLTSVKIANGVKTIEEGAFILCESLAGVTIPDSVTTIGIGAFAGCDALVSITLPDSVTTIESSVFNGCHSLTNVTLPRGTTTITPAMFAYCTSLKDITMIPGSVTTIGARAFYGCDALKNITIPSGVTTICKYAFDSCDALASVTIPGSVATIEERAFSSTLKDVYYEGTEEQLTAISTNHGSSPNLNLALYNATFHSISGLSGGSQPPAPTPAAKPTVVPTAQKLTVDGTEKNTEIYNIDGSNFFKLRDMAALLSGTGSQFSVGFDGARNTIVVKTGEAYTAVGGELSTGTDKSASAVASAQSIEINGQKVELTAYNIGGNNFFKLRELGTALGFDVDYDKATATMLVKSR